MTERRSYGNRRFSLYWLRRVKKCVVCGKDDFSSQRYSRAEITATLGSLKWNNPPDLLSVNYSAAAMDMTDMVADVRDENDEERVHCALERIDDDDLIALLATEATPGTCFITGHRECSSTWGRLAVSAFFHDRKDKISSLSSHFSRSNAWRVKSIHWKEDR